MDSYEKEENLKKIDPKVISVKKKKPVAKDEIVIVTLNDIKRTNIFGYVVRCGKLRVRKSASAKSEILLELLEGTKVEIDLDGSSESFYKVIINKREGFCMKAFIEVT